MATFVYGYDSANRVATDASVQGLGTFINATTVGYSYDVDNELTGASGSRTESYSYDFGGDRTGTGYSTGSDNDMTSGADIGHPPWIGKPGRVRREFLASDTRTRGNCDEPIPQIYPDLVPARFRPRVTNPTANPSTVAAPNLAEVAHDPDSFSRLASSCF